MPAQVHVEHGDMREVLPRLVAEGVRVHSVITDPPYHLESIVKRFAKTATDDDTQTSERARAGSDGMSRFSRRFMGKTWDAGDIAFQKDTWQLAYDVLLPGGHLLAFGATRNYHRMACAIEDAGFEIRDMVAWLYGSGMPKSHNTANAIKKAAIREGMNEGEAARLAAAWDGWGTGIKPALEPICFARKPITGTIAANVLEHGTGAINVDACRVIEGGRVVGGEVVGRWPANVAHDSSPEVLAAFPERVTADASRFFYSPKASAADRGGSLHPSIKPVDLIRYYARLVTPPGGTILDPFAGSGTLAMAAMAESFHAILIERDADSVADIHRRIAHVHGRDTPLFSEAHHDHA